MAGRVFIGTSGWNYRGWSGGVFYPEGLKPAAWLAYYARHFDTVEINNTFYRLPEKGVFESWRDQTPDTFRFAVKASRFITHMKKLLDPDPHIDRLLSRANGLEHKLSVVLFQLPPFWRFNAQRLERFGEAIRRQQIFPDLRVALEVRHPSWLDQACVAILRQYKIALAFADWPSVEVQGPLTADFVFLRRHGPSGLYSSDYPPAAVEREAERIREWRAENKDVYVYFNNDAYGFAVKNACALREKVEAFQTAAC